jgi:hypothetical protein
VGQDKLERFVKNKKNLILIIIENAICREAFEVKKLAH